MSDDPPADICRGGRTPSNDTPASLNRGTTTETTLGTDLDVVLAVNELYNDLSEEQDKRKGRRTSVHFRSIPSLSSFNAERLTFSRLIQHPAFDVFIGLTIIMNTSLVGIEQSYELQERFPGAMLAVESVFLCIFLAELGCRLRAHGVKKSLKDSWIRLDIVLLVIGVTVTWLLSPAILEAVPSTLTNVGVLRAARVFRLARMVRLVMRFQSLWMLMQGLLNSINTMLSVLVVLTGILYMFACIGFDMVGKHEMLENPEADDLFVEIAQRHFSSLPASMLTIFSFLVFDDVRQIYWPLVDQDPALMFYFLAVVFTVGIVLANLITAVLVNGAIEQASQDKDAKALQDKRMRERRMQEIIQLFRSLDDDSSGMITRAEARSFWRVSHRSGIQ
eukprot:TRINITY_DN47409_c0_g1_i1.p1 TRINITY_DN47409_c0_g1~~TRINITY_DN47409_c0_g1_i1.p1  ORF type:complete len:391 (-),score=50.34 TRINITY_DN47409_c0_g1_i1:962-2134(-)